jgi:hypothetical protein
LDWHCGTIWDTVFVEAEGLNFSNTPLSKKHFSDVFLLNLLKNKNMELNFEGVDRSRVAVYKRGEEPSDVLFWLTRPPFERLRALELIRQEYNQWKYGTEQGFQRVYRIVKRKRR